MSLSKYTQKIHDPRLANLRALAWPARMYFRHTSDRKIAAYRNRVAEHRYGGHRLTISLEDPVAESWYDHDWPLMPELDDLAGHTETLRDRFFLICLATPTPTSKL